MCRTYGSLSSYLLNADGLKSVPTICFEPMALCCKSSVGAAHFVATDFNPDCALDFATDLFVAFKKRRDIFFYN